MIAVTDSVETLYEYSLSPDLVSGFTTCVEHSMAIQAAHYKSINLCPDARSAGLT